MPNTQYDLEIELRYKFCFLHVVMDPQKFLICSIISVGCGQAY